MNRQDIRRIIVKSMLAILDKVQEEKAKNQTKVNEISSRTAHRASNSAMNLAKDWSKWGNPKKASKKIAQAVNFGKYATDKGSAEYKNKPFDRSKITTSSQNKKNFDY